MSAALDLPQDRIVVISILQGSAWGDIGLSF
jgi:hypothetical protein